MFADDATGLRRRGPGLVARRPAAPLCPGRGGPSGCSTWPRADEPEPLLRLADLQRRGQEVDLDQAVWLPRGATLLLVAGRRPLPLCPLGKASSGG